MSFGKGSVAQLAGTSVGLRAREQARESRDSTVLPALSPGGELWAGLVERPGPTC